MLNFIATGLSAWLLSTYFRNRSGGLTAETKRSPRVGRIPSLDALVEALGFHFGRGVVLHGFLAVRDPRRRRLLRAAVPQPVRLRPAGHGHEPVGGDASGVNPKRMILKTIMLSGAVAGLIGMGPLLADPQYYKYGDQFPQSLGFTGLSLALLGRNIPVGIAVAALVWAAIERATQPLSTSASRRRSASSCRARSCSRGDRVRGRQPPGARRRRAASAAATSGRTDRWRRRREPRGRDHGHHAVPSHASSSREAQTWFDAVGTVVVLARPSSALAVDVDRPRRSPTPTDLTSSGTFGRRLAAGDPDRPRRPRRPVRRAQRHGQHRPRGHDDHGHDHRRVVGLAVGSVRRP